jgi:hypothetical protein
VYARKVWLGNLRQEGLLVEAPSETSTPEDWWLRTRATVETDKWRSFDTLEILIVWLVWKQRNAQVFQNTRGQCDTMGLINRILDEWSVFKLHLDKPQREIRLRALGVCGASNRLFATVLSIL